MHDSFRLLSFNPYDDDASTEESDKNDKEFIVQMFGINEKGDTASIFVIGYTPFFYVKVDDGWDHQSCAGFISQMRNDMGNFYENSIIFIY